MSDERIGKRIKMIMMPDDPNPITSGEMGTITAVDKYGEFIEVKWDNGRTLSVITAIDVYAIYDENES